MDQNILEPDAEPNVLEVGAGAKILDAWCRRPKFEFRLHSHALFCVSRGRIECNIFGNK